MGFGGCGFETGAIRSFLARWRVPVALSGDLFVGEELMVLRLLTRPEYNNRSLPDVRRTVTSTSRHYVLLGAVVVSKKCVVFL